MDKKERILKAARRLFVERGLQATPMSSVAKTAGTGMGTIYNYFESKEELVNAIYLHIKAEEHEFIFHDFDPQAPIRTQFEHIYGRLIKYFFVHPYSFRFLDQFAPSPVIREEVREQGYAYFEQMMAMYRRGQEMRIIKAAPTDQLNGFVYGGISTFLRPNVEAARPLNEAMLQQQLQIAWDAVKA